MLTLTTPDLGPATLDAQVGNSALLTDLYQLTMIACYCDRAVEQQTASFELFTRRLPDGFGYLVATGLEQALQYLEQFQVSASQQAQLRATGLFDHAPDRFWDLLATARFTGDLWAVPEGTVVFAHEPLLRIEAPLWQAQWVETYLLNVLNYQTLVATRSARLRDVAGDRAQILEFGTRRAFSPQAALWAARAALAAGLDATSNVEAALQLGRQPAGTMAHALVMALGASMGSELAAFEAFQGLFPHGALLVDTFDPVRAIEQLAERVRAGGAPVPAIRLDSGDLVSLSQLARDRLPGTQILVSGDLDEAEIDRLRAAGAEIDGYGVGTKLVTGQPVNGVYKLVELAGQPVAKGSSGKATYPGRKQVLRDRDEAGRWLGDRLVLADEVSRSELGLLRPVMRAGQRLTDPESLLTIAQRTRSQVQSLPEAVRSIHDPTPVRPELSPALQSLTTRVHQSLQAAS